MKVKEIMSRPIITEEEDTSVVKVADALDKLGIGSVVITKNGEPVGIITERDLVTKVMLKDKKPSDFLARDIMSSPLTAIDSEASISDASKLMSEKRIRTHRTPLDGSLSFPRFRQFVAMLGHSPPMRRIIQSGFQPMGEALY